MPILAPPQQWLTVTQTAPSNLYWQQLSSTSTTAPLTNYWTIQNVWNTSTINAYHSIGTQAALPQAQAAAYWQAVEQGAIWRPPIERPRAPAIIRSAPAIIRSGRRALRRSMELYRRLRGPAELAAFLAGNAIEVEGHRYRYSMRRFDDAGLLKHTMRPTTAHIPYKLYALDKITRRPLASGCVTLPGTPVIDQLLAVIMHTQDPDAERHLIANTNWTPRLAA